MPARPASSLCVSPLRKRTRRSPVSSLAMPTTCHAPGARLSNRGDLLQGVPGPGGDLDPERLLDQAHEHRPVLAADVDAEGFAAPEEQDARAIACDGKLWR